MKFKTMAVLMATTTLAFAAPAMAANQLERADKDMKEVLDAQMSLKPKPIEKLTAKEARLQPTPSDGVKKVLLSEGKDPNDPLGVATKDLMYKSGGQDIKARVYMPKDFAEKMAKGNVDKNDMLPVIVYYHGGGWVIADIDVYDSTPRSLAKAANAIVVSAEYRHAPENKFPAAHDDAFAAYQWTLQNAASWGGDARRIAVVGESAGGNLAINTAIKARDAGIQQPAIEVLVYPVAGVDMNTPSYKENADAKPLSKPLMAWFMKNTIKSEADKNDPRLDLIGKANLKGLPPTTIINAEIDPLRSDGEMLAEKLQQAGVKVKQKTYEGVTHEFFGMGLVVDDAKAASTDAVSDLKAAFDDAKDRHND